MDTGPRAARAQDVDAPQDTGDWQEAAHFPRLEYRALPRSLPDREPFARLSAHARLLELMLRLTLGPSGIELIPPKRFHAIFEERCGLTPPALRRAVQELTDAGCLRIEGSVVWCVHQLGDDPLMGPANPKHRTKIRRDVAMVPDQPIRRRMKEAYAEWFSGP